MAMPQNTIQRSKGDTLGFVINHIDNQAMVMLNQNVVIDRRVDNDPPLHVSVDLTAKLNVGQNSINIAGADWGGGWHFQYWLTSTNGLVDQEPRDIQQPSSSSGIIWHDSYVITVID
jgi:hypothetical protein